MRNIFRKTLVILFWLVIWYVIALLINNDLLFPGPIVVLSKLISMSISIGFWTSIIMSILRVVLGIVIALITAVILSIVSYKFRIIHDFVSPLMKVARATPVASFIILIALFIGASTVPSVITIIMVFPIIWQSVYDGLSHVDNDLKEVCIIYKLSFKKQLRVLYFPSILPQFSSAVITSIGLGWKAGIAAEILFPPVKSIGKAIYDSNWLLKTEELFAWTLVVILLSIGIEELVKVMIKATSPKTKGGNYENK